MEIFLVACSMVCAVVPMVVFLAVVWWMDRYDREPLWLLTLVFMWGAIGGVVLALIGSTVLMLPVGLVASAGIADATGAVVIAPLIEEPAKAAILLLVIWNRHFDNMTDGFVYGAAAGLGFGMTENFLYFASVAVTGDPIGWAFTVVLRTLYSAVMHASASSLVGAALGFARFRGCIALIASLPVGLAGAMAIHALWNGLLTLDAMVGLGGAGFGVNLLLFPLEFLVLFGIYNLCLWVESSTIQKHLQEEAAAGLIPATHPPILASYCQRNRRAWVPKGVNHHKYVYAATTLAFRKSQLATASGARSDFYKKDVERLRAEVAALLAPKPRSKP